MRRIFLRGLGALIVVAVIAILALWMVLESSYFRDWRVSLVEEAMTKQIGQTLVVDGDVGVSLFPLRLFLREIRLPSEAIPERDLATVRFADLYLNPFRLLSMNSPLRQIVLRDVDVQLISLEDGTTSWSRPADEAETKPAAGPAAQKKQVDIIEYLGERDVEFRNIHIAATNQGTGFEFEFLLSSLDILQQRAEAKTLVAGGGVVNGKNFEIEGTYPYGAPFETRAEIGAVTMNISGVPRVGGRTGEFVGEISVNTEDLADLFQTLRLSGDVGGSAQLTIKVDRQQGVMRARKIDAAATFRNGTTSKLSGSAGNLMKISDVDLSVQIKTVPEGVTVPPAQEFADLRLISLESQISSVGTDFKVEKLLIDTNSIDGEFGNIGPITVGQAMRTHDGYLALKDIIAIAGDKDSAHLIFTGDIADTIGVSRFSFSGKGELPARTVLKTLKQVEAQSFGSLVAEVLFDDASGTPSLTALALNTRDTDLWSLGANLSIGEIDNLEDVQFGLDLSVADPARFLGGLGLKPVALGAFTLGGAFSDNGNVLGANLSFGVGRSDLKTSIETFVRDQTPVVRGNILSDLLSLPDLQNLVLAGKEIASLVDELAPQNEETEQPLVLPAEARDQEKPEAEAVQVPEPLVPEQPLVLPKSDVDVPIEQPLVIGSGVRRLTFADVFLVKDNLKRIDFEVPIDIRKLTGQKGVSRIRSDFTIRQGKLQFGPLDVTYGGGNFRVNAGMNFNDPAPRLRLNGATSGWDIGEILETLGVELRAYGKPQAQFDLSGRHDSIDSFLSSMSGQVAVTMGNGRLSTSLLELSGLGVIPWLFSSQLHKGYTDIVCVSAPLTVRSGKVTTKAAVIETARVQIVMGGAVDWKNDTIALRGEPRPVGKPLARSPFPFQITGKLSAPAIQVIMKGVSKQKAPLAMPTQREPCRPDAEQLQRLRSPAN